MSVQLHSARFAALFLVFPFLFSACEIRTDNIRGNSMSSMPVRLKPIFEKTRTVCFGRFTMEVPATALVIYGPAEAETPIEYAGGQAERLNEHLAVRLSQVEEERKFLQKQDLDRLPLFGKVIDGVVPGQKIVFGAKSQIGYAIHSYIPLDADLFIQHLNIVLPDDERVTAINRVAKALRMRAEDEIPVDAGSCIQGGFVPIDQTYERVTVGIRFKEFADVHLSAEVHKNGKRLPQHAGLDDARQEARLEAESRGLSALFASIKELRKQPRSIGRWQGFEVALKNPAYKNETENHQLRYLSPGAPDDALLPRLDVRLDTGLVGSQRAKIKPSLTDEETMALWDTILGTIKVRQPTVMTETPRSFLAPLSTLAPSGSVCPQTGWWQCSESRHYNCQRLRRFNQGDVLPGAVLVHEPTLWGKLTGKSVHHEVSSVWQLIAYDDDQKI